MHKRGLSDLVTGILLILLVITISFLLFEWLKGKTGDVMEKGESVLGTYQNCEDVDFWISDAYCEQNGELLVIKIGNNKNIDFQNGFTISTLSETGRNEITTFLYGTKLLAYEEKEIKALRQYEEQGGNKVYAEIDFVEIVPRVQVGEDFKLCVDKKQKVEVKNC